MPGPEHSRSCSSRAETAECKHTARSSRGDTYWRLALRTVTAPFGRGFGGREGGAYRIMYPREHRMAQETFSQRAFSDMSSAIGTHGSHQTLPGPLTLFSLMPTGQARPAIDALLLNSPRRRSSWLTMCCRIPKKFRYLRMVKGLEQLHMFLISRGKSLSVGIRRFTIENFRYSTPWL